MKLNKTRYIEQLQSNEMEPYNNESFSDEPVSFGELLQKQSVIDSQFEESATPVFLAMLVLSVSTFIAAFFQVGGSCLCMLKTCKTVNLE